MMKNNKITMKIQQQQQINNNKGKRNRNKTKQVPPMEPPRMAPRIEEDEEGEGAASQESKSDEMIPSQD